MNWTTPADLKRQVWGEPEDDRIEMAWDKFSPANGAMIPGWDFNTWTRNVRMHGVPKTSGAVTRAGQALRR